MNQRPLDLQSNALPNYAITAYKYNNDIGIILMRFDILHPPSRQSWLKFGIQLGVFQCWLSTRLELSCCRSGFHTQSITPLASVARFKAPLVVRPGVEAQKRISRSKPLPRAASSRLHLAPRPSTASSRRLISSVIRATNKR